jgi:hypothetical protein
VKESKKIIEKIKKEKIQQIPKWYFVVPNILIWLGFAIFVFVGAVAFSIILLSIQQTDFNLVSHMSHSRVELFLGLLPFFWIITLLIFLAAAIFTFKKSKKGYKFGWPRLLSLSTAASFLLGILFFIGGGSGLLENTFAEQVSYYECLQEKKQKIWMRPEEGFLSGTIEKVDMDRLQLIDFNNKKWDIDYGDAVIAPPVFLEKGEQVKLIGKITLANTFQAKEVRPWDGKNNRNKWKMKIKNREKN